MTKQAKLGLLVALFGLMVTHGGCGLFAGAASMRIEVEVYKGPLSKEPEIQFTELSGLLNESLEIMEETQNMVESIAGYAKVFNSPKISRDECALGIFEIIDRGNCLILASLHEDAKSLEKRLQSIISKARVINPEWTGQHGFHQLDFRAKVTEILVDTATVSAEASAKAFSWSIASIAGVPLNPMLRIALVHFVVSCSEVGKQLNARADGLLKQMDGLDRRELPLSVQLRETDATEFLQLYDWLDAHAGRMARFIQPGSVTDRTKAVRRLFADHHWSNINTVYASGWGKGSMALIKDDIGNWNLKNFDSDPEDLLRAYKDAAVTAVETAAKAAKAGFSGGGAAAADKLLEMASQYFSPPAVPSASTSGTDQYRSLRERTALKLENLAAGQKKQDTQADEEYQKAVKALQNMKLDDPEYAKQEETVQELKKGLITRRMETIQSIERILNEHSELVDLLAKGTIGH